MITDCLIPSQSKLEMLFRVIITFIKSLKYFWKGIPRLLLLMSCYGRRLFSRPVSVVLYLRVFLYNEMSVNYLVVYLGIFYLVEARDCFNNCVRSRHLSSGQFPSSSETTACLDQVSVLKTLFEKKGTKPDFWRTNKMGCFGKVGEKAS